MLKRPTLPPPPPSQPLDLKLKKSKRNGRGGTSWEHHKQMLQRELTVNTVIGMRSPWPRPIPGAKLVGTGERLGEAGARRRALSPEGTGALLALGRVCQGGKTGGQGMGAALPSPGSSPLPHTGFYPSIASHPRAWLG